MAAQTLPDLVRIAVSASSDIILARQRAREIACDIGFSATDRTVVATAVSELARNIVQYAGRGSIELIPFETSESRGLRLVAADDGPGIPEVALALQDGFSTSGGLGLGLPGVRRLMDEFDIRSRPDGGTEVRAAKRLPAGSTGRDRRGGSGR